MGAQGRGESAEKGEEGAAEQPAGARARKNLPQGALSPIAPTRSASWLPEAFPRRRDRMSTAQQHRPPCPQQDQRREDGRGRSDGQVRWTGVGWGEDLVGSQGEASREGARAVRGG